jgi:hypothetical protein
MPDFYKALHAAPIPTSSRSLPQVVEWTLTGSPGLLPFIAPEYWRKSGHQVASFVLSIISIAVS